MSTIFILKNEKAEKRGTDQQLLRLGDSDKEKSEVNLVQSLLGNGQGSQKCDRLMNE